MQGNPKSQRRARTEEAPFVFRVHYRCAYQFLSSKVMYDKHGIERESVLQKENISKVGCENDLMCANTTKQFLFCKWINFCLPQMSRR